MQSWDAIVIGAGSAGLMTAIFGAQRGGRILVLESADEIGGTLHISSGRMSAAGTKYQKAAGIEDTADEFFDDVMRICRNTADPALVRLAVDNAAETFDWFTDRKMSMATPAPVYHAGFHEAYLKPRYAWGVEYGKSILKTILPSFNAAIASGRVCLKLRTRVIELLQDANSGTVTGVRAKAADGPEVDYRANNVVIATGGFGASAQMMQQVHGCPLYNVGAAPTSQGDGIRLGLAAGGYVRGAEHFHANFGVVLDSYSYPSPSIGRVITWPEMRKPWEIYVDSSGRRFVREDEPSVDARERALVALPDRRYWVVFDQKILDESPPLMDQWSKQQVVDALGNHPMFLKAASIRELAALGGMDHAEIEKAIAEYNRALSEKDAWGREHRPLPIAVAPFYAIRQHCTVIVTTAGLVTDGELRVVDGKGTPIPNLYAAGEVLGSVATMGDAAANGMLITPALTFGRLLGSQLLKFQGHNAA